MSAPRSLLALACVAALGLTASSPVGQTAASEYPNVRVSTPQNPRPNEVAIAVNPVNPLNLVVGSNLDYAYYSLDGGWSWTEQRLPKAELGVSGDPSLAFDAAGRLFYAHLSNPPSGYKIDRIVVQASESQGVSFEPGVGIGHNPPKHQDKSWITADLTDSPHRDNLYVAWTEFDKYGSPLPSDRSRILLSRSVDSGSTWSDPVVVSDKTGDCRDGDTTVEGAVPAVGPNGEVYTSWSGPFGILFDKSTDGGRSFGEDVVVSDQPGGWAFEVSGLQRVNGMPVTLADTSPSPYRGTVYVVWSDQRIGPNDTDVFISRSTDGGATWSPRRRVNDDAPGRHQFFHWATVDPVTGHVWVAFYDRRDTEGDATDVFVALSTDGGDSFRNVKVSESSFVPDARLFLGDYIGIAAWDGRAYPVWTRIDANASSVWMALVE